jgi:single-strand DNA-binding protein
MAGESTVTIVGNMGSAPELRFTPSGSAVANFRVAQTPRVFDRNTNQWKDGETLWMRCNAWRDLAENIVESLTQGMPVVVTGRLKSRTYDDKSGEKRTVMELEVDAIGPNLAKGTAKFTKHARAEGGNSQPAAAAGGSGGGWGEGWGGGENEPPF